MEAEEEASTSRFTPVEPFASARGQLVTAAATLLALGAADGRRRGETSAAVVGRTRKTPVSRSSLRVNSTASGPPAV